MAQIPPQPLELKAPRQPKRHIRDQEHHVLPHSLDVAKGISSSVVEAEENGRERLKRHRVSVAGRVWVPDMWGQEDLLKDWIDCTSFDAPLVPSRIMMARNALVEQGTRATSGGLRIENRC